MKSIPFILILSVCISCKNSNNTKASSDKLNEYPQAVTTSGSNRTVLIQELKRIKAAFASKDKERIADIFPFPLSDSIMGAIAVNPTYIKELNDNGGKTTRAMFIKYFDETYKYLQIEEINELFKYLNVDELNHTDTLAHDVKNTKEPCYKYYQINVSDDTVTLIFGTNGNSSYVDPDKNLNEDEKIGDECEYASYWIFKFDGKKLRFIGQSAAG